MSKIKITQIKSPIGRKGIQRKILISLGLNKINRQKIVENSPSIQGMVEKVKHLLKIDWVIKNEVKPNKDWFFKN